MKELKESEKIDSWLPASGLKGDEALHFALGQLFGQSGAELPKGTLVDVRVRALLVLFAKVWQDQKDRVVHGQGFANTHTLKIGTSGSGKACNWMRLLMSPALLFISREGILETENFKGEALVVYHTSKFTGTHDTGVRTLVAVPLPG